MDTYQSITARKQLKFSISADTVEVHRFVEIRITATENFGGNPFTDVSVPGTFENEQGETSRVEGFCDSLYGTGFIVRFMPRKAGPYKFKVLYKESNGFEYEHEGTFTAIDAGHRGMVKADPLHPWHFVWEGTGEHYFWNGTTAYYLMGFENEAEIRRSIDRLHKLKINRLRVLLYGRQWDNPWGTPVVNNDTYSMTLNPWEAKNPKDVTLPEFDLKRFNVEYWRKYERMLEYAREKDIIVSVIFFIGGQPLPAPFQEHSEDEYRYYRYAIARLAAYSNITWDLGNEHDFHRCTRFWTGLMGQLVKQHDPYGHPVSAHNKAFTEEWDTWIDMQLMQIWDAGLNRVLLEQREKQRKSGRIVPQIIEEYGYEDLWEKCPGQRSADTRRRCAWEVYMAGGYQTNGESPRTGTGMKEDTGGGWVNGRGDDSMTMLKSFTYIVDFFSSFEWWKTEPGNDLVLSYDRRECSPHYFHNDGTPVNEPKALCLADPGRAYVFYLPAGGTIAAKLQEGSYSVSRYNPRSGEWSEMPEFKGICWASPELPDSEDWAFLLREDKGQV